MRRLATLALLVLVAVVAALVPPSRDAADRFGRRALGWARRA